MTPMAREPDVIIGLEHDKMPTTVYVDAFFWTCQHCGWLGTRHFSLNAALKEAGRHCDETHPELEHVQVERRDSRPVPEMEARAFAEAIVPPQE